MLQSVVSVESFRTLHTGERVLTVNLLMLQELVLKWNEINKSKPTTAATIPHLSVKSFATGGAVETLSMFVSG